MYRSLTGIGGIAVVVAVLISFNSSLAIATELEAASTITLIFFVKDIVDSTSHGYALKGWNLKGI